MKKKPHVLLMANYSNKTGYAWNNIYKLYNVIGRAAQAHNFGVCFSFANIDLPVSIIDDDLDVHTFCYDPYDFSFRNVIRLIANIYSHNIKYVYATDLKLVHWVYLIMRLMGVKVIVVHCRISVANPYRPESEVGFVKLVKTILTRITVINVSKIYCVSDFTKYRLIHKNCIPENKLIRILNGVDIDNYNCTCAVSNNKIVNIFIGARATKYKGIHVLFEAGFFLIQSFNTHNFKIIYAGDGPYMSTLKKLVKKYNLEKYVVFLGEVSDTKKYLCSSDVVVIPSLWGDACPSAVSEAMASGKSVITSRAGGIPEIVGDEGNAIILEPGDVKGMAEKLDLLIKNSSLRKKYGENARLRAEKALDMNKYHSVVVGQIERDFGFF